GVLGVVAAILSQILLKEPERIEVLEQEVETADKSSVGKVLMPKFLLAFIVIFVSSVGLAAFESFFAIFADHKFAFTPNDIAIAITGGAIVGAISQVLLFDPIMKKLGEIKVVQIVWFSRRYLSSY